MPLHRTLRRGGAFAALMVFMLALGIGATTAIFSVVNGVLLQPLQFHDPGQLVLLGETVPETPGDSAKFAYFDTPSAFLAWRRDATSFSALSAVSGSSFTLANAGAPRLLHGAHVSVNFFELLGVHAQLGRTLAPGDAADTSRPMVISDRLWRSAFGADPAVLGRHIGASGVTARVVGVLPANFRLEGRELGPMLAGQSTDYFDALEIGPGASGTGGDLTSVFSNFNYHVIGRLRAGVTVPEALAQLNLIQANLARASGEKLHLGALVTPLRDYAVANAGQELWLLLAGVLAVLLIVCVNLGGLWLTRLADRRRDWAIRAALGAAPGRLARQLLVESLSLALLGGLLGIACAAASLRGLLAIAPANLPRLNEVHLDWRVAAFGLLLALLAGLITGVVPALRLGRSDPQASLKASGAATTADRSSLRSRQTLIGLQAALATLLLAAAGLLGLSLYRLLSQPTGIVSSQALSANVVLNVYSGDLQREQMMRRIAATVAAISGVQAAAFTSHLPLQGETWIDSAGLPGKVYPAGQEPAVNVRFISPGYFSAAGVPLLAGRDLAESDRPAGWPPKSEAQQLAMPSDVVLSRAAVQLLWPGLPPAQAVGQKIKFNGQTTPTVVGVAADTRASLTDAPPAVVYQPYWEQPPYQVSLILRTALPPAAIASSLRAAIWSVAPAAPIPVLQPLSALASDAVAPQQYQFLVLLGFALVALLLAALGVYALVAHSVARRAKELAIRLTLGARAANLWSLVVGQALLPVLAGAAAGLVAALAVGRLLASLLFQVSPSSPAVLVAVGMSVLLAGFLACALPALRAGRSDPLLALRAE